MGLKELVVVVMDDERDFFFFFWSVCGSEACFDLAKDLRLAGGVITMAMDISMDKLIEIIHRSGCGHFFVY